MRGSHPRYVVLVEGPGLPNDRLPMRERFALHDLVLAPNVTLGLRTNSVACAPPRVPFVIARGLDRLQAWLLARTAEAHGCNVRVTRAPSVNWVLVRWRLRLVARSAVNTVLAIAVRLACVLLAVATVIPIPLWLGAKLVWAWCRWARTEAMSSSSGGCSRDDEVDLVLFRVAGRGIDATRNLDTVLRGIGGHRVRGREAPSFRALANSVRDRCAELPRKPWCLRRDIPLESARAMITRFAPHAILGTGLRRRSAERLKTAGTLLLCSSIVLAWPCGHASLVVAFVGFVAVGAGCSAGPGRLPVVETRVA